MQERSSIYTRIELDKTRVIAQNNVVSKNGIKITNLNELDAWLAKNHSQTESIWLIYYKPTTKKGDVTYTKLVDVLLTYGWIDSLPRKVDQERTSIRISPRNPKSNWSRVNKEKIAKLEKAGRMKPAGKKLVALAKETGTWDALNDVENLIVPEDLLTALTKLTLLSVWESQSRTTKRGWLEQLFNAKRPGTRTKTITKITEKLNTE